MKVAALTASASSASMAQDMCLNTRWISLPSASTWSTASYAVVGMPTTPGLTSIMVNTGSLVQNLLKRALICMCKINNTSV